MKTVHLFDDMIGLAGSARQQRVYRSSKVLYSLVTKAGNKINPVSVWVDAALSCVDAINSYLRLQRSKEVTHQLEMVKKSLLTQLEDQRKIVKIIQDEIQSDQESRLEYLERYFQSAKRESDILIKHIYANREEVLLNCKSVSAMRHLGSYSKELSLLIKVTDDLVFATLNMINSQMG